MKFSLDFELLLYGIMLVGLGAVACWLVPEHGFATGLTGVVAGVVTSFWAVLGLLGFRKRRATIGTLVAVNLALLVQAGSAWLAVTEGTAALKPVAVILTLLLGFGLGQLIGFLKEDRPSR